MTLKKIGYRANKNKMGVLFLLIILVPSIYLKTFGPKEIYPFYTWRMFRHANPNKKFFSLEAKVVNGKVVDPPQNIFDLRREYLKTNFNGNFFEIDHISKEFIKNNDLQKMKDKVRKLLASDVKKIRLQLNEVIINKKKYALFNQIQSKVKIKEFEIGVK